MTSEAPTTVHRTQPRPPLPKQEQCRRFERHWISPLDIHFTHDNINSVFTKFKDPKTHKLLEPSLLDTVKQCIKEEVPESVEMIDVVWHNGKIHVAGTFNRR